MALSYTAQLKLPTTETFTNTTYGIWYQLSIGSAGPFGSYVLALNDMKTELELNWGGTFSYTESTAGGITTVEITYSGLTTDPALDPMIYDLSAIYIQSDGGNFYTAAMIPAASNAGTGTTDCEDCYQQEVIDCDASILLEGLDGVTTYTFDIEDENSGVHYTYEAITDAFGTATITVADFPSGLFNPYTTYTVTVTDADGEPVQATLGYVNYNCYQLQFIISSDYTP